MAEYIGEGALHEELRSIEDFLRDRYLAQMIERTDLMRFVFDFPAESVAPIRHGRWIEDDDGDGRHCSECGKDYCYVISDAETYNFCPNCGVPMDLDVELDTPQVKP